VKSLTILQVFGCLVAVIGASAAKACPQLGESRLQDGNQKVVAILDKAKQELKLQDGVSLVYVSNCTVEQSEKPAEALIQPNSSNVVNVASLVNDKDNQADLCVAVRTSAEQDPTTFVMSHSEVTKSVGESCSETVRPF